MYTVEQNSKDEDWEISWSNQDILNYREYIHDNPLCTWVITKEDIYKQNTSIFMSNSDVIELLSE
ncbi:hypothetical protein RI543_000549 [Arxiozyma heterogenica]|uniref:Uncharacterized protein n=1 Tax=Arxiozyma heterogenica TaxID=278026 RepID=A0AAN7WJ83_9SACH|nr:hypothetical protein RI543_000549 [Kazachstania heterogenica]